VLAEQGGICLMKTNRFIIVICVLFVYSSMFFVSNVSLVQAQSLSASPSKIEIGPSHKITVTFSGAPGNHYDAIALYKVGETKPITYQWLTTKKNGILTFDAPQDPGSYEFQMWENNWKKKIASSNRVSIDWGKVTLSHNIGTHYIGPNKKIQVSFSNAPGYHYDSIGMYKVGETKPIIYQWLTTKTSGNLEFTAPEEPGSYEFQIWGNNWKKHLSTTKAFTVDWKIPTLKHSIGTHYIGPGKKIQVSFQDAPGYHYDSIGMYKVGETKQIIYQWLTTKTSGNLEFTAPEEPGSYEFQIWGNNWKKYLKTSTPFTVKWGPVSMKVSIGSPDTKGKRKITVQYSGAPGYHYDAIGLNKAGTNTRITYQWLTAKTSGTVEFANITETDNLEIQLWANNWKILLAKTQAFIPKNGPPPPVDQGPTDPTPPPPPPPPPTPDPPPPAPDKPFTLRAYPGDGKVFLEWTPPQSTSNVIGYNLYRKTSRIPYGSPITDFPVKGLNHTDMNVDNGMQACYYMKAVYSDKTESAASNEVCVTPNAPKATINIPANATTTQSSYTFTGKVPPGSTVMVNGAPVTVGPDGSFTATVKLNPGKNTITVVVKTKTGDTITSTHTVTLTTGADSKITIVLTIGSKNAYVNQQLVVLDVAPFIDSGRTFVPFRFVGESLGAEVGYTTDASGRVATVTYKLGSTSIILYIGRKDALVNGRTVYLDVAPKIVQGRTVIPLRFVTEALGCKVDWDGQAMKVTIIYPA
jgi:hypothetical protein